MADAEGTPIERNHEFYRMNTNRYITEDNHFIYPTSSTSMPMDTISVQQPDYNHPFMDYPKSLLETLNYQRIAKYYTDITIRVQHHDFAAHRCILVTLGKRMEHMIYHNVDQEGILTLDKLSFEGFKNIMDYLYTGLIRLHSSTISETLTAAQILEVQEVERACLSYLKNQIQDTLSNAQNDSALNDQQQNMLSQPNTVDTSYLEDYLKVLEQFHNPHDQRFISHDVGSNSLNILQNDSVLSTNDNGCIPISPPHSSLHIQPISPVLPEETLQKTLPIDTYNKEQTTNLLMSMMHVNGDQSQERTQIEDTLSLPCVADDDSCDENSRLTDTLNGFTAPLQNSSSGFSNISETEIIPSNISDCEDDFIGRRKKTKPIRAKTLQPSTALPPPKKRKVTMVRDSDNDFSINTGNLLTKVSINNIKKPLNKHTCSECNRSFSKDLILRKHMKVHQECQVACRICKAKFIRSAELTRHNRKEHSNENWICKLCCKEQHFGKDSRAFRLHMKNHHNISKAFACTHSGCSFKGNKPSTLEKHSVIHTSVKEFKCTNCLASFSQPNGLRSHMNSCQNKRSYLCDHCGVSFNHSQSLKTHKLTHSGAKPHICQNCGAKFTDIRNLRRHRRIHENIYPYKCDICNKVFRHSNSLKTHMKTHTILKNSTSTTPLMVS